MTKRHPPASRAGLVRGGIALSLLSLAACPRAADPASTGAQGEPAPTTDSAEPPAEREDTAADPATGPGPRAEPAPTPRVAASGLDPGQALVPFDAIDVEAGETLCPPCLLASTPGVLVAGAVDDPEFAEDLLDVLAVIARHRPTAGDAKDAAAPELRVFGIVGTTGVAKDGGAPLGLVVPPPESRDPLLSAARVLRRRLELPVPLVVPEDPEAFAAAYRLDRPRTIMLVGGDGRVRHTAVDPEDLADFDRELATMLAGAE